MSSLIFYCIHCYIEIPFNISDRKDSYKQILPLHSFNTFICSNEYSCNSFGISFSTYVTWQCINRYSFQEDVNSVLFSTSHGVVRGNVELSEITYKDVSIRLNIMKVTKSNDMCYLFRNSYGLEGEIGLNVEDLQKRNLSNYSMIEQLDKEMTTIDKRFILVFNDNVFHPEKGVLLFGNNRKMMQGRVPTIMMEFEKSFIKSSKSYVYNINFKSSKKISLSNNIFINKRVVFTYENKITFIPENYYESFMNIFVNYLYAINSNSLKFDDFCRTEMYDIFFKYIICRKDVIDYFEFPVISFEFSDKQIVSISLKEMFYENKGVYIFGIGFNIDSNSIILGINFFKKFISEYDVKNKLLKLYEVDKKDLSKIFGNKKNFYYVYMIYCCISLLIISLVFLFIIVVLYPFVKIEYHKNNYNKLLHGSL